MAKLLFFSSPNLNLLRTREPSIYGFTTRTTIRQRCQALLAVERYLTQGKEGGRK